MRSVSRSWPIALAPKPPLSLIVAVLVGAVASMTAAVYFGGTGRTPLAMIGTLVFVVLGLIIFALAFFVIAKATPFSVRKEIEEDHNIALAVVIASVILGSALIIAAAIHG